jgi:hypothetical protein
MTTPHAEDEETFAQWGPGASAEVPSGRARLAAAADALRPRITVDHLGDGEYRVRALHDPAYRLPDWLGLGYEMSAATAAEIEREYGSGTLVFDTSLEQG